MTARSARSARSARRLPRKTWESLKGIDPGATMGWTIEPTGGFIATRSDPDRSGHSCWGCRPKSTCWQNLRCCVVEFLCSLLNPHNFLDKRPCFVGNPPIPTQKTCSPKSILEDDWRRPHLRPHFSTWTMKNHLTCEAKKTRFLMDLIWLLGQFDGQFLWWLQRFPDETRGHRGHHSPSARGHEYSWWRPSPFAGPRNGRYSWGYHEIFTYVMDIIYIYTYNTYI